MAVLKRLVKVCHSTAQLSPVVPISVRITARALEMAFSGPRLLGTHSLSGFIFYYVPTRCSACSASAALASLMRLKCTQRVLASGPIYSAVPQAAES